MVTRKEPSKYLRKGHCWQRAHRGASREEQDGSMAEWVTREDPAICSCWLSARIMEKKKDYAPGKSTLA